jgi:hypothetical protein
VSGWTSSRAGGTAGLTFALLAVAGSARATSQLLFGYGPRDVALAQADVADASPACAAYVNPAFAATSGTRVAIGYGHGWTKLELNGADAGVRDIAGTDLALQLGSTVSEDLALGGAVNLHLPNRSLARIAFSPGTEPVFVRFDPASQRTTADAVVAIRYAGLSLGVGASLLVSAEGQVDFLLGQDGNGTYADGESDVSLPYELTPIAGLAADLGPAALALRYRGAQSVDLDLGTKAMVEVQGNPLNGVTHVAVSGASGYVPATVDASARWSPSHGLRLMSALQLARWSRAPSPAADLAMDVDLGLSPGQREGRFVRPAYRDTLSPRVGLEVLPGGLTSKWALRAGYAFTPSPIPEPKGFASPADAPTHTFALGAGLSFGLVGGVDLRADAAGQLVKLQNRTFDKGDDTIPFARYEAGGYVGVANVSLEGTWR